VGQLFTAARTLVLKAHAYDGLAAEIDDVARIVARWPSLRAVDVFLRSASYLAPIVDRLAAHVTSITVRGGTATATFDRVSRSLAVEMHYVNEYEVAGIKNLIDSLNVTRAELRVREPGGFDGERLRLRNGVARIGLLADAARRRGIALVIQGTELTAS
jgi:hypothetical protein